MYVTFKFFIVFVCLSVCPGGEVSERTDGSAGGPGSRGAGSRRRTGSVSWELGRNYSHPRFINSAAPAPVRVRQRYPCPSTYPLPPATAHPPPSPSPWEADGRPLHWLRLASPRMPSAASIFLPPSLPPSLLLPPPPCAPPAPCPDGRKRRRAGSRCPPPLSPAISQAPISSTSKVSRTSVRLWLPLLRAVGLFLRKAAFLCRGA